MSFVYGMSVMLGIAIQIAYMNDTRNYAQLALKCIEFSIIIVTILQ